MNVAVMGCRNIKDETCIGCQRCLTAFDRKEGEFERYKDVPDAKLIALFNCGGCPATSPVLRMVQLRDWMAGMGEKVDAGLLGDGAGHRSHRAHPGPSTGVGHLPDQGRSGPRKGPGMKGSGKLRK